MLANPDPFPVEENQSDGFRPLGHVMVQRQLPSMMLGMALVVGDGGVIQIDEAAADACLWPTLNGGVFCIDVRQHEKAEPDEDRVVLLQRAA